MTERKEIKRGLGRGLSALMADVNPQGQAEGPAARPPRADRTIPIERIEANPDQPRKRFTEDQIEELAASIRQHGVIQPVIVRAHPGEEGKYQIVAGERRWRAAQKAQLHELPAIIRDFSDTEVLEVAIIENIQRADLNAIEEAAGYRQLMDRFGHSQEKLAEALGKSRSHIANLLRLLNLPARVQDYVSAGQLTAGHARALVTADDAEALADEIVRRGLSVRETERLVKSKGPSSSSAKQPRKNGPEKDADTVALEQDLSSATGLQIAIGHENGSEAGTVSIRYRTLEELDRICALLSS